MTTKKEFYLALIVVLPVSIIRFLVARACAPLRAINAIVASKQSAWLKCLRVLAICTILLIPGNGANASQDIFGRQDPEVAAYLSTVKYIKLGVSWPSRESQYFYGGYYDYMKQLKFKDYDFRYPDGVLQSYGFFYGGRRIFAGEGIKDRLYDHFKANAGPDFLNGIPILPYSGHETSKKYYPIDEKSVLSVRFFLGQQKTVIDGREALMGAVGVELNPVGYQCGDFRKFRTRFYPEPFLIYRDDPSYESLDRALDFITLQAVEYLRFLGYEYRDSFNQQQGEEP